ncbi:MAG: Cna B-type domain-containing protein [[Eubacterium] sulci]|nr:Cna B-type domain-containing protein [[Eubacterium] sulci]MBF1178593.1 Cna B-type domain-containing protein [[Eubacterium] sulci]
MKKKSITGLFLCLFLVLGCFFQSTPAKVYAAGGTPREVDTRITKFEIYNWLNQKAVSISLGSRFFISMDWDAGGNGVSLNEGDYFYVDLPEKMVFPSDSHNVDFQIVDKDNPSAVIANAHVTPASPSGGKVKVTFTNYVNGRYNIKGNLYMSANFNINTVTRDSQNTFESEINGQRVSSSVYVEGPTLVTDEGIKKWESKVTGHVDLVEWGGRINHKGDTLHNVVMTDKLDQPGEKYVPGSFKVRRVVFDAYGYVTNVLEELDLTGRLTISPDGSSFTLNLPDMNGDQYDFSYRSTYTPGTVLKNNVVLTATEKVQRAYAIHMLADSGGQGTGTLANKIKIVKIDADDNQVKLADAEFKITRVSDGREYTLKTDANGEAVSSWLRAGQYKLVETKAPAGYEADPQERLVTVQDGVVSLQTIENAPMKVSVNVKKLWVGEKKPSVKVHLYADDVDTGKELTLNEANAWTASFANLRKYNGADEIKYTVKEERVSGYSTAITGDSANGYVITNTQDIPPQPPKTPPTPKVPNTYDANDMALYAGILLLGTVISFGIARKKNAK